MRRSLWVAITIMGALVTQALALEKEMSAVSFGARPFWVGYSVRPGAFTTKARYWSGKDLDSYGVNVGYGLSDELSVGLEAARLMPDEGDDATRFGGAGAIRLFKRDRLSLLGVANTSAVFAEHFDAYELGGYALGTWDWEDEGNCECCWCWPCCIFDSYMFWCGFGGMYEFYTFDWDNVDDDSYFDVGGAAGVDFKRGPFQVGAQYGVFDKPYFQFDIGYTRDM